MKKIIGLLLITLFYCGNDVYAAKQELQRLIDEAEDGAVIQLEARVYEGDIIINKPITIEGQSDTVIKGKRDSETTVTIEGASDVTIRNVMIDTKGTALVVKQSEQVRLQNLSMWHVQKGIVIQKSKDISVSGSKIGGNDLHYAKKGNGVAVYNSETVGLIDNEIRAVQDGFYIEGVKDITIERNIVKDSRYGTHFMYSSEGSVRDNHYTRNVTGLMIMMTADLQLENNSIFYQEGFNGTGITLFDAHKMVLQHNNIIGNRIGLTLQSTTDIQALNNLFQMNQTAVESIKSSRSNRAMKNIFIGNLVNARSDQSGLMLSNNFYDDYSGIDLNGDGTGEEAYVALQSFGQWMVRKPVYQYFVESPSIVLLNTIDKRANLSTKDILVDDAPLTTSTLTKETSVKIHFKQLLFGLFLLLGCIVLYRRSVVL
ncbi:right-handed parallel beta-helix repeat-containing protein [Lysinibacillus sp. 54212]|uniref:right-handed parallel beta-helix repeat-containing protein n=1 Tax=Lysinibacillus sp. 54212 TaxID=3119829 RepID=UPI002FC810D1